MNNKYINFKILFAFILSIFSALCFFLFFLEITVKPASAEETTDTPAISLSNYVGSYQPEYSDIAYPYVGVSVTLDSLNKTRLSEGLLGDDVYFGTQKFLVLVRATSPEQYYSFEIPYEETSETLSRLYADVKILTSAAGSYLFESILQTRLPVNLYYETMYLSQFLYFGAYFESPKIDTNYYYWAYMIEVSCSFDHNDDVHYYLSLLEKSSLITNEDGSKEVLKSKPSDLYRQYLEDSKNYSGSFNQRNVVAFQKALGYFHEEKSIVSVKYNAYENNTFLEKTESYEMDNFYLTNKELAIKQIVTNLMGKSYLDFNVYKKQTTSITKQEGESGFTFETTTDVKPLLEVDSVNPYIYEFTKDNTATISINYKDFTYMQLYLQVFNNSENLLTIDIYPIEVSTNLDKSITTITFSSSYISELLFNKMGWLVTFDPADIYYTRKPDFVVVEDVKKTIDGIEIVDGFSISFPTERENELMGMEMSWCAVIIPDCEYTFTYDYIVIAKDLSVKTITSEPEIVMLSDIQNIPAFSFYQKYKNTIDAGLRIEGVSESLAVCSGANKSTLHEEKKVHIVFSYKYTAVIKATNSVNDDFSYYVYSDSLRTKEAGIFNFKIPEGYRINSFVDVGGNFEDFDFNKQYPEKTLITIAQGVHNLDKLIVYELKANCSDRWMVSINYLKPFKSQITGKDSCFATMETFTGEVSCFKYDLYNLSCYDVGEIILEATGESVLYLTFKNIEVKIADNGVKVELRSTTEGDVYFVTLEYTKTFFKKIDSDGFSDSYEVGLTPFSEWKKFFAHDTNSSNWNLTALAPNVFKYSDAVDHDKLYGFFSVMTFKEQVTNFNSWFKEYTSGGAVTFFSQQKVQGSGFYKFLMDNEWLGAVAGGVIGLFFGHPIKGALAGSAVQFGLISASEWLNDENGTYYSYFFYLDGTSTKNYVSHNGADDYYDESSSFQNFLEKIKDGGCDLGGLENILYILAGVFLIVLLVQTGILGYIVKIIVWVITALFKFVGWIIKSIKARKNNPQKKAKRKKRKKRTE